MGQDGQTCQCGAICSTGGTIFIQILGGHDYKVRALLASPKLRKSIHANIGSLDTLFQEHIDCISRDLVQNKRKGARKQHILSPTVAY